MQQVHDLSSELFPMQDWWLSFETFTNTYTGMTSLTTLTADL